MNLKAIIQKIASWFKSEAKVAETKFVAVETKLTADEEAIRAALAGMITAAHISAEAPMSTPAVATVNAPATTGNNVNTAVQIALAIKAIDASLSVEAVQAATNAALAAAYPVAAAA
jgi:hypothetical protein